MDRLISCLTVLAVIAALLFATGIAMSIIRRVCEPKMRGVRGPHNGSDTIR